MPTQQELNRSRIYTWLLDAMIAVLFFGLLREWVHPLFILSGDVDLRVPFLIDKVFACFVLIPLLRLSYFMRLLLGVVISLSAVSTLYNGSLFLNRDWLHSYFSLSIHDALNLLSGNIDSLSQENRLLIFLIGWLLMISAVQSILMYKKQAALLVGLTWAYLISLQFLTGMDTSSALTRALALGLFMLTLLHFAKIRQLTFGAPHSNMAWRGITSEDVSWKGIAGWLFSFIIIVGLCLGSGYLGARSQPKAIEPMDMEHVTNQFVNWFHPYSSEMAMNPMEGGLGRLFGGSVSGYGRDDSQLGGPLQMDDSIVFVAQTDRPAYWRGESKNYYTGSGWEQKGFVPTTTITVGQSSEQAAGQVSEAMISDGTTVTQEIFLRTPVTSSLLFAGGTITRVDELKTADGKTLFQPNVQMDSETGKVTVLGKNVPFVSYRLQVRPTYTYDAARSGGGVIPNGLREVYLQLPDELPQRVKDLARQIVSSAKDGSDYNKAVAIENYLHTNMRYSTAEVKFPGLHQDFVDDFLFNQKLGYCDHFSTAMVVMLRTVGVSARWVKGFAEGDAELTSDGSPFKYAVTVRNRHAHAWVEVYIPSQGWIAFEPTPGFTGLEGKSSEPSAQDPKILTADVNNESSATENQTTLAKSLAYLKSNGTKLMKEKLQSAALLVIFLVVLLLAALFLLLRNRRKIGLLLLLRGYQRGRVRSGYTLVVMERIWKRIFQKYGAKPQQATIREYVEGISEISAERRQALAEWGAMYEAARYGPPTLEWLSRKQLTNHLDQIFHKRS